MDKSRSRPSHIEIIDYVHLKSPLRRLTEGALTFVLWAAWAYWILPVMLTLLLWVFGVRLIIHNFSDPGHLKELQGILRTGGISMVSIFFINILWIVYNLHYIHKRFGKRRRNSCHNAEVKIAKHFDIKPGWLMEARHNNRFEITLSNGKAIVTSVSTVLSYKSHPRK